MQLCVFNALLCHFFILFLAAGAVRHGVEDREAGDPELPRATPDALLVNRDLLPTLMQIQLGEPRNLTSLARSLRSRQVNLVSLFGPCP